MLERKLALAHIPRVGLAQHCVTETRNHASRLEYVPESVSDCLVAQISAQLALNLVVEVENLSYRNISSIQARETNY